MAGPKGKFTIDLYWSAGAFALAALLGVLLNLVIIRSYDAAALGAFNLVYAIYILLSQLAVGGVHLAVQAFVPRELAAQRPVHAQVTASLLIATLTSLVVMALAWWGSELPGEWFESAVISRSFILVVPGLIFFSWNKVLLGFHNGARRMRALALLQLLRFVFLFLGVIHLTLNDAPVEELPVVLCWAEMALFAVVLPYSLLHWRPWERAGLKGAVAENFRFGNRALMGNLLLDVNTKVDVLLLGMFMEEGAVGLYSFAATIVEGLLQLPGLLRNNINPVLSRAWYRGGAPLLQQVVRRNRRAFQRLLAPLLLVSIILFPAGLWIMGMNDRPLTVWGIYAILTLGAAISSGDQPFLMIFGQIGAPGVQTVYIAAYFLSNVLLNLALIPVMGLYGSALATALSFIGLGFIRDRFIQHRSIGGAIPHA
jgi:O-antigen/teichoic acid export membrane protein